MLTKKRLQEQLDQFPEEFTIDELVERLIFMDKIEKSEKQSLNNETIPHEDVDAEILKWFK